MVVKWAGAGKNWAVGKLKAAPMATGKFAAGTAQRAIDSRTEGWATRKLTAGREWLEKKPLIGKAVGGPGTYFAAKQKALSASADKFKNLRPNDIEARLKQTAITPQGLADRAGMIKTLIDKGQFSIDTKPEFKDMWLKMLQTFQNSGGSITDLLKTAPDLAWNPQVQKMIARDVNAPPPVREKWQKISEIKNVGEQDETIKKTIGEDIIKTAADFARIRKESVDMKGKLNDLDKAKYDGIETDKDALRRILMLQEERDRAKDKAKKEGKDDTDVKELENEISRLKDTLSGTNSVLTKLKQAEDISRKDYLTAVKQLQSQQIAISGRESQVKVAELFLEQLKKDGRLYVGSLNNMESKNKDAHINLLKFLKTNMATMERGDFNNGVYEHVFSGLVSNTMTDQTGQSNPPT